MTTTYTVEVEGTARELYSIEADSPEEAREIFEGGHARLPFLTEVSSAEIVSIEADE